MYIYIYIERERDTHTCMIWLNTNTTHNHIITKWRPANTASSRAAWALASAPAATRLRQLVPDAIPSLNDMVVLSWSRSSAVSLRTDEAQCTPERVEDPTCSVLYLKEVEGNENEMRRAEGRRSGRDWGFAGLAGFLRSRDASSHGCWTCTCQARGPGLWLFLTVLSYVSHAVLHCAALLSSMQHGPFPKFQSRKGSRPRSSEAANII